jgi:hypothetical protein
MSKQELTEKIMDIIKDDVCGMCPQCDQKHKERCYAGYRRQAEKIAEFIKVFYE